MAQPKITSTQLLTGVGSGLDADTLDGVNSSTFQDASNLTTGTLPSGRLSGTYNIDIDDLNLVAELVGVVNSSTYDLTFSGLSIITAPLNQYIITMNYSPQISPNATTSVDMYANGDFVNSHYNVCGTNINNSGITAISEYSPRIIRNSNRDSTGVMIAIISAIPITVGDYRLCANISTALNDCPGVTLLSNMQNYAWSLVGDGFSYSTNAKVSNLTSLTFRFNNGLSTTTKIRIYTR